MEEVGVGINRAPIRWRESRCNGQLTLPPLFVNAEIQVEYQLDPEVVRRCFGVQEDASSFVSEISVEDRRKVLLDFLAKVLDPSFLFPASYSVTRCAASRIPPLNEFIGLNVPCHFFSPTQNRADFQASLLVIHSGYLGVCTLTHHFLWRTFAAKMRWSFNE